MGWALAFGSSGADAFNDIALESNGDVVAVGSFTGSVTFGGPSLSSKGGRDAVVARLDSNGNHIWSKAFGGSEDDDLEALALDASGNVYAMGRFTKSIDVDGQMLMSVGSNDGYVIKLDGTTGNRVWAFEFGGLGSSDFQLTDAITVSTDGAKLAISGQFYGTANFGGTNITHSGGGDAFVAVYATADGSHLWSQGFGGTGVDEATGVAFDGNDGVIAVGAYVGPAAFGGSQPLSSNAGSTDVFVARYAASNGAFSWANGYGSAGPDKATKVRAFDGAIFVTGSFSPTPAMGISLGGDILSPIGSPNGFIAKYDAATGSHIWSKAISGTSENSDDQIVNLSVTDQVWTLVSFGGAIQMGNASYASLGVSDVAFGAFSASSGAIGASGAFGGPNADVPKGIAASATSLCIAGSFTDSIAVYGNPLSGAGMTDAFIGCKTP